MNPRPDRDALLQDVLAEAEPAEFHEALLDLTLRQVRRRRRLRRARRVGGLVLALALVVGGVVRLHRGAAEAALESASHQIVRTEPLAPSSLVRTQPFDPSRIITSAPFVAVVRTDPRQRVRFIDDAELLALAGPGEAVLIRTGAHSKTLIQLDGEAPRRIR